MENFINKKDMIDVINYVNLVFYRKINMSKLRQSIVACIVWFFQIKNDLIWKFHLKYG